MIFLYVPAAFIRGPHLFEGGVYSNTCDYGNAVSRQTSGHFCLFWP